MMRLFLIYKSKHIFMRIYLTFIRGKKRWIVALMFLPQNNLCCIKQISQGNSAGGKVLLRFCSHVRRTRLTFIYGQSLTSGFMLQWLWLGVKILNESNPAVVHSWCNSPLFYYNNANNYLLIFLCRRHWSRLDRPKKDTGEQMKSSIRGKVMKRLSTTLCLRSFGQVWDTY